MGGGDLGADGDFVLTIPRFDRGPRSTRRCGILRHVGWVDADASLPRDQLARFQVQTRSPSRLSPSWRHKSAISAVRLGMLWI